MVKFNIPSGTVKFYVADLSFFIFSWWKNEISWFFATRNESKNLKLLFIDTKFRDEKFHKYDLGTFWLVDNVAIHHFTGRQIKHAWKKAVAGAAEAGFCRQYRKYKRCTGCTGCTRCLFEQKIINKVRALRKFYKAHYCLII